VEFFEIEALNRVTTLYGIRRLVRRRPSLFLLPVQLAALIHKHTIK
jgi:hypothetical protein